jgi:protein-tyrosine phosphatase
MRRPNIKNWRDLSDVVNAGGARLRPGVVYRSALPARLEAGDIRTLHESDIRTVYDLRSAAERETAPRSWPLAADAVRIEVIDSEMQPSAADLRNLIMQIVNDRLDASEVGRLMSDTYRTMPVHFGPALGKLMHGLAGDANGATLIHCTAGKDRTGFVCATLLQVLDVPIELIDRDYMSSAQGFPVEAIAHTLAGYVDNAPDRDRLLSVAEMAQVRQAYLDVSRAEIARHWGTLPRYLQEQAGVSPALLERLRRRLLI